MLSLRNRLRKKYNVSFAELDYQKKWQRAQIGIVSLNSQRRPIETLFQKIISDAQENIDGEIIDHQMCYF